MTVYYLDFKDGNDSNDGTSFANRKKTIQSFGSTPGGGDEIRVAGQPSTLVDANAKIINGFVGTIIVGNVSHWRFHFLDNLNGFPLFFDNFILTF